MTEQPHSAGVLAWHFVSDRLRDGRPIRLDGETLRHDGPLVMCESGLHASERIIDALRYAPGATACRVECGGEILRDHDKLACRERTVVWRVNAEGVLQAFARRCALDVIHLWRAPDIVRRYLESGEDALAAAATAAATAAASDAASAVWAAFAAANTAWPAANAAWAASSSAAHAAAVSAAVCAARAARDAARDAQNARLTALVEAKREESQP